MSNTCSRGTQGVLDRLGRRQGLSIQILSPTRARSSLRRAFVAGFLAALVGCGGDESPELSGSPHDGGSVGGTGGTNGRPGQAGAGGTASDAVATVDPNAAPQAQCEVFREVLCSRTVDCVEPQDETEGFSVAECVEALDSPAGLPCARADAASPTTADCVADLQSTSCSSLFPPGQDSIDTPGACFGLFSFTPTAAETQCAELASAICSKWISCDPDLQGAQALCELELRTSVFGCAFVRATGPDFAACQSDITNATCETFLASPEEGPDLPTSCAGDVLDYGNLGDGDGDGDSGSGNGGSGNPLPGMGGGLML